MPACRADRRYPAQVDVVAFDPSFLPDLYRICLLTGDEGKDARPLYRDGDLLGHFFAAPYGVLEPASCFMLVDIGNVECRITGYQPCAVPDVSVAAQDHGGWRDASMTNQDGRTPRD